MKILKIGQQMYPNIWIRFIKILLLALKDFNPSQKLLMKHEELNKLRFKLFLALLTNPDDIIEI